MQWCIKRSLLCLLYETVKWTLAADLKQLCTASRSESNHSKITDTDLTHTRFLKSSCPHRPLMKRMNNDSSVRWSRKEGKNKSSTARPLRICCLQDKMPNLWPATVNWLCNVSSTREWFGYSMITITLAVAKINTCALTSLGFMVHPQSAPRVQLIGHDRSSAIWIILPQDKSDFLAGPQLCFCGRFFYFYFLIKKQNTKQTYFSVL